MCPSGSTCLPEDGCVVSYPGADPGFQARGAHLNKLRRAEGGAKFVGVCTLYNLVLMYYTLITVLYTILY
jgi:hypothetical protein